jgi:hypothetical protein
MRVSSYFKPVSPDSGNVYNLGSAIYKAQVQKIIYPDDPESLSKIDVEYEVLVEMSSGMSTFKNVPSLTSFGGGNDYEEFVFEPAEAASTGKNDNTNTFKNRNGSLVAVAFFGNNFQRPIIIGAFSHPKEQRRKKADGISYVRVVRGLKTEINKDGEWTITYQSPYGPDGKLTAEATGPSFIKLDKKGSMLISLKKDTIKQTHDVDAEKTEFIYKSGLKVTFDGKGDKVTVVTKGGAEVTVDGSKTITVKAGSTEIVVDGNSGKIELKGDLVDVGTGASALAALGPQLIAWLSSHTHMGDGGPVPAPTSPPLVPPPSTLLSKSVKLKD